MTDQETILKAVHQARRALSERSDPNGPGETETLLKLFAILDDEQVVAALRRLDCRNTFDVVSVGPLG